MSLCSCIKKKKPTQIEQDVGVGETVPKEVALVFKHYKKNKGVYFNDPRFIAEINLGLNSKQHRLFIYDRKNKKLHTHKVSHGSGGKNASPHDGKCREVSNIVESHMSSLGLYECMETYYGSKGYSMRLNGYSKTNSKARVRAIVIHGSNYVHDNSNGICGRSWGCPSVDWKHYKKIINMLKGGSPLFMHYNNNIEI